MLITKISKILQKYFWVVAGIFLVLISLSMFFYQRQSIKVKKYDYSQYIIDSNIDFEYSVENSISDENSYVNGWCIERNKTYTFYNYGWGREGSSVYNNIHLGCINGDNVYEFPTRLGKRDDVNQRYDSDGIDYLYCGFTAYIPDELHEIYHKSRKCIIMRRPTGEAYLIEVE